MAILISGVDVSRWKVESRKVTRPCLGSRMYSVIALLSIGGWAAYTYLLGCNPLKRGVLGFASTSIVVVARSRAYGYLLESRIRWSRSPQCAPSLTFALSTKLRVGLRMIEGKISIGTARNM